MDRLTLLADVNAHTGYGQHLIAVTRGLTKLGIFVSIRAVSKSSPSWGPKIPEDILQRLVYGPQPEPIELIISPVRIAPTPGKRTIYWTMHESTIITKEQVQLLNQAEVVVVPSHWNASCFSACGVTARMVVIPLGIDPDIFAYRKPESHKPFVFGAAGNQAHGESRKGLARTITAFQKAFPDNPDVRLKVKSLPDHPVRAVADRRVEMVCQWLPDEQLAEWYASLNCFVSLARGEGWGLMQHQAMAVGRPVITSRFGGVGEFLDARNSMLVEFDLVHADAPWNGLWAAPCERHASEMMRRAYQHPAETNAIGKRASKSALLLTWGDAVSRLVNLLDEFVPPRKTFQIVNGPKCGIMAYLPPKDVGHTDAFLANLRDYPPSAPIVFLTDGDWPGIKIESPTANGSDAIACQVFTQAIQLAHAFGWEKLLWLETDCRVRGSDWDTTMFKALNAGVAAGNVAICCNADEFQAFIKTANYQNSPARVLMHGSIGKPVHFVNGAPAVYSVEKTALLLERLAGKYRIQDRNIGEAVRDFTGGLIPEAFQHIPTVMATAGDVLYPTPTLQSSLEAGLAIAVHPIKTRWRPAPPSGHVFYHSGDLGDIIYALKAVAILGGTLWIGNDCRFINPREPMSEEKFQQLLPLLEQQRSIRSSHWKESALGCSVDFNETRQLWQNAAYRKRTRINNLCHMYCHMAGASFDVAPWLVAESKPVAKYVFNRSQRWPGRRMNWQQIVDDQGREAIFVGLPHEHEVFTKEFGYVPYFQVGDFAQLAAVINGADAFYGNQSFACALAIGLGKEVHQETSSASPDCLFPRPNFWNY